jgi:hypothetical protein
MSGKDDIHSGAESDEPEELSSLQAVARLFPAHDPSGDQTRNLPDNDPDIPPRDSDDVLFVDLGCFIIESGLEFPSLVFDLQDFARYRRTVNVNVENVQKDADCLFPAANWRNFNNLSIRRRNDKVFPLWDSTVRVAEKKANERRNDEKK